MARLQNKWLNTFDEIHDMFIWHTIVLKVDEIDKSIEDEAKHILGNFEQIREVSCSKAFQLQTACSVPLENEILWCHYYQNICDIKNLDVKVIKVKTTIDLSLALNQLHQWLEKMKELIDLDVVSLDDFSEMIAADR